MFIDKNSIMINNISFGQYLTSVEYQYNKLWAEDSGRNLAGEQSGTLIGIFPKIILNFRKLTRTELETIAPILDSATQNFTYYDLAKKRYITIETYTGDYNFLDKKIIGSNGKNEEFSISFIAVSRRV